MSIELKIKSKHLSLEAKVIKFEEKKLLKQLRSNIEHFKKTGANEHYPVYNDKIYRSYSSIRAHRILDVRKENRSTYLARAYIEGKDYTSIEQKRKNETDFIRYVFPRFVSMVLKYTPYNELPENSRVWDFAKRRYVVSPEFLDELKNWCNLK